MGTRQYKPLGERHAVVINGRATSLYLSEDTWAALRKYCALQRMSVRTCVGAIDLKKGERSLAQAVRDFLK